MGKAKILETTPGPWRSYLVANGNQYVVDSNADANHLLVVSCGPPENKYSEGNSKLIGMSKDLLQLAVMVKEATDNGFMPHQNIRDKVGEIFSGDGLTYHDASRAMMHDFAFCCGPSLVKSCPHGKS